MEAGLAGVVEYPIQPAVAFRCGFRMAERFTQQDQIAGVHDGDVGITLGHLMFKATRRRKDEQIMKSGAG